MSRFEKVTTVIQLISMFFLAGTLYYGATQIKLLISLHQDNHDWNRRVETRRYLNTPLSSEGKTALNEAYDHLNQQMPIPLIEIERKIEKDKSLQVHIHTLLNYYERLSAGVFMGVYDEEMVKNSKFSNMYRFRRVFGEYIQKRQSLNRAVWTEYDRILNKWNNSHLTISYRRTTGNP